MKLQAMSANDEKSCLGYPPGKFGVQEADCAEQTSGIICFAEYRLNEGKDELRIEKRQSDLGWLPDFVLLFFLAGLDRRRTDVEDKTLYQVEKCEDSPCIVHRRPLRDGRNPNLEGTTKVVAQSGRGICLRCGSNATRL